MYQKYVLLQNCNSLSAFDNSCEIYPLWLFAEDLPKEAAQLTKIRFSILLADQVLLRGASPNDADARVC